MMKHCSILSALLVGFGSVFVHLGSAQAADQPACRCLPGDECWPSTSSWNDLNSTVDGRLIATVPIGSPCHDPSYDAEACAALQERWMDSSLQYVEIREAWPDGLGK